MALEEVDSEELPQGRLTGPLSGLCHVIANGGRHGRRLLLLLQKRQKRLEIGFNLPDIRLDLRQKDKQSRYQLGYAGRLSHGLRSSTGGRLRIVLIIVFSITDSEITRWTIHDEHPI
jgi:hypothetical protein